MSETQISQTEFQPTLEGLGDAPFIRFWYTGQNFIAGDGVTPIIIGDGQTSFFKEVTCSIVSERLRMPATDLWATTDGQPATSRFFGQLYSEDGAPRDILFGEASGWQLPTIYGAVIAYDQLMRYNRAAYLLAPPPVYFTQEQTIAEILRLAGEQNYAGFGILGRTQLSVAPINAAIPIAISNNDVRGIDISSYATFAAMIAATGSTPTTFNVHTNISIPASATVPSTLTLRFLRGGGVTIATGQTLTIQGPIIADPVKVFYNALSGQGTIALGGNKSNPYYFLEWWGLNADWNGTTGTDDSGVIMAAFASVPTDSVLTTAQGRQIAIASQVLLQGKRNIALRSWNRVANFGGGAPSAFWWTGASTDFMYELDSCQGMTIDGWYFGIKTGQVTDGFIDIDGDGFGGTISTANDVFHNTFNATNQNNANFKAVSISRTSFTNNEHMRVSHNTIACSNSGLVVRVIDTGTISSGSPNLTVTGLSLTAADEGKRIRVGLAGAAGASLDTSILTVTSGDTCVLAANASATVSRARVIVGEALGVGIYVGLSANALGMEFIDNTISFGAKGIQFSNGSGIVDVLHGGTNDVDVYLSVGASIGEGIRISNLTTESSLQGVVMSGGGPVPVTISHHRSSNDRQLPEGYYIFDGSVQFEHGAISHPPPFGGRIFGEAGSGGLFLIAVDNDWNTASNQSINYLNSGFGYLSENRRWISIGNRNIVGMSDQLVASPLADAPIASYSLPTSDNGFLAVAGTVKSAASAASNFEAVTGVDTLVFGDDEIEKFGVTRPSTPHVQKVGTHGGSASYIFSVVAVDSIGNRSLRSYISVTTAVANTLSASNYLFIVWPPSPGASSYELYRQNPANDGEAELVASGIATNSHNVTTNPAAGPYTAWTSLTPNWNQSTGLKFRARRIDVNEVTFTASDATPSVAIANDFLTANALATTVTNFDNGIAGQTIRVRIGDANTTIQNGASISTGTGGNVVAVQNAIYCFTLRGTVWYRNL